MKRILVALILFIMSACNTQTARSTDPIPSQPNPATTRVTYSPRPSSTQTLAVSSINTPIIVSNKTQTTPSATPEPILIQTKSSASIFDTPDPNGVAPIFQTYESPDGKWNIEYHTDFQTMSYWVIISKDGSVQWRINDFTNEDGFRHIDYRLGEWSVDGNYLYLHIGTLMDGWGIKFTDGEGMARLNLKSGEITPVFGQTRHLYAYQLSPDQSTLAFIIQNGVPPLQIVLLDMRNGEKRILHVDPVFNLAGWIRWSPDSQKFIYLATQGDIGEFGYSYFVVDTRLNPLEARKFLSGNELLYLSHWYLNKGVLVFIDDKNYNRQWSWLNPNTGNLIEAKECAGSKYDCYPDSSSK